MRASIPEAAALNTAEARATRQATVPKGSHVKGWAVRQ